MKSANIYIDLMEKGDTEIIVNCISETPEILQLNALLFGTKYRIKDKKFISELKNRLSTSETTFFGVPMKKFATAALDILGVQKYNGDDAIISRFIKSGFSDI